MAVINAGPKNVVGKRKIRKAWRKAQALLAGACVFGMGLSGCFQRVNDGFDCQIHNGTLTCDGGFDFDLP